MKYINKIASFGCLAMLALLLLTACESMERYQVDSPSWLSDKIDSIADSKNVPVEAMLPEPALLGNEDNSTPWWTAFTSDFKAEPGKTYQFKFINYSNGINNWNNFLVILRNEAKDYEYAILRADCYGWGTGWTGEEIDQHCTVEMEVESKDDRDWGAWLKAMTRAQCVVNISCYENGMCDVKATMKGVNGTLYRQNYLNLKVDPQNLYMAFTVEGGHLEFVEELTDFEDSEPASLTVMNAPKSLEVNADLKEALKNVTGTVTFQSGDTKDVTINNLEYELLGGVETPGNKQLVLMYNKTLFESGAVKPAVFVQQVVVGTAMTSLQVTKNPTRMAYTIYDSEAVTALHGGYPFDPTGIEVTATYSDGTTLVVDNSTLTFSTVPAATGTQNIIIDASGVSTTLAVQVTKSDIVTAHPTPTTLGPTDNSGAWWTYFSDDIEVPAGKTHAVSFTNYSSQNGNWNNWNIVLRRADKQAENSEYGVVRSDNYGWWYGTNPIPNTRYSGGQADWAAWLAAMNGAKVTVYITNCGDGTADVQAVMRGTDNKTYYQYYLGVPVNSTDLWYSFIIDGSHLVFD